MARMTMESIDEKIKKAEDRVAKTGRIYNEACEELQKLREKRLLSKTRLWWLRL